ncbi:MAG: SUMF1/EgtB/PvdO family nonheme iron enzyme, partial [bacterium]|nr:SUMF1/EgtB/PvdO family nonheme iron enzyme [bacterium]
LADAVAEHRFLVVIGDPGAGKTTFLRYVAHHQARRYLDHGGAGEEQPALPLLLPLRTLAAHLPAGEGEPVARSLPDAIAAWLVADFQELAPEVMRRVFAKGRLLLLLDGLDEVPDETRREQLSALLQRSARFLEQTTGPGGIVVTSRPRAYHGAARLTAPFDHGHILPLSDAHIERFAGTWMTAVNRLPPGSDLAKHAEVARETVGLLAALRSTVALRQLSRSPILLTVLALVYEVHGKLPEQRVKLYDEAVDVLLRRFKDRRRSLRGHLAAVAVQMMGATTAKQLREEEERAEVVALIARRLAGLAENDPAEPPRSAVHQASELLDLQEVQAGLLIAPDNRHCRFVHRTFQEYLAAWRFADEQTEGQIHATFHDHLGDASWQETLRLIGGVLAAGGSCRVARLLSSLVGDPGVDIQQRAPGIASAMALLGDVEQFDIEPTVLEPIRTVCTGLLEVLESPETPLEVRIGVAEALGRAGDPRIGWKDDEHMLLVPEGPFWIGGFDEWARDWEKPPQQVHLWQYRIARTPVTCRQYAEFIDDGGYRDPRYWAGAEIPDRSEYAEYDAGWMSRPNHPVVNVSWFEAQAFCRWLNRVCPRDDGLLWRLPTEAEWEKAARGGLELGEGRRNPWPKRRYPWGEQWDPGRANCHETGPKGTTPVGCYPGGAGPYGTWDQAGNVWEWCLNWFSDDYSGVTSENPVGPSSGSGRVVRGGSWVSDADELRVCCRGRLEPAVRLDGLGFRLAAAPLIRSRGPC